MNEEVIEFLDRGQEHLEVEWWRSSKEPWTFRSMQNFPASSVVYPISLKDSDSGNDSVADLSHGLQSVTDLDNLADFEEDSKLLMQV
jgi:hypothetical protein